MQVSIAFAEAHAAAKPYPYPVDGIDPPRGVHAPRRHVLRHRAPARLPGAATTQPLYRFADFNAGHYASRNAAFQNAVSVASGIPLVLDGDLVRHGRGATREPGNTELADARARRAARHRATARSAATSSRATATASSAPTLYERVFALADTLERPRRCRARCVPRIELQSPKITRKLTTEWFANRVDERHRRCLARAGAARRRLIVQGVPAAASFGGQRSHAAAGIGSPHKSICSGVPACGCCAASPRT